MTVDEGIRPGGCWTEKLSTAPVALETSVTSSWAGTADWGMTHWCHTLSAIRQSTNGEVAETTECSKRFACLDTARVPYLVLHRL
jgi:hypothetical protein